MRRSFRHLQMLGLVAMVSTLQACSFSSTQLDLLSLAWNREPDLIPYEQLAWTMIWSGTSMKGKSLQSMRAQNLLRVSRAAQPSGCRTATALRDHTPMKYA